MPSHRTVPSFGCKDIQLLIKGRRGAEGEVEHSQGLFYRKAMDNDAWGHKSRQEPLQRSRDL